MALPRRSVGTALVLALAGLSVATLARSTSILRAQSDVQEVSVDGNDFAFEPSRIEVRKDSLVKVTFHATDIAHSFTVDSYRISKRAAAGHSVVFEFRADQAGTFPFYCNLTQDPRCRNMRGQLIVR